MSTEIRNAERRQFTLDGNGGTTSVSPYAQVLFGPRHEDRRTFDRAELTEAIESELGVIVFSRTALPEVGDESGGQRLVAAVGWHAYLHPTDPARHRQLALAHLALAEYLDAHPPVDEAEVEALAEVICKVDDSSPEENLADMRPTDLARRLLATGRIEVKR